MRSFLGVALVLVFVAHALPRSELKTRNISTYLVGPSGAGKSSLGNELTNSKQEPEENSTEFAVSGDQHSKTKEVGWRTAFFEYLGLSDASPDEPEKYVIELTVGDTPGLADTDGETTALLDETLLKIKKSQPHSIVFVVKHGRLTTDLEMSFQILAETLGPAILSDSRRVALFVNMLPSDFQFSKIIKPIITDPNKRIAERKRLVDETRDAVSQYLGLSQASYIQTAIGNTMEGWDGVPPLQKFLGAAPDCPMDTSKIRLWSEVKQNYHDALKSAESREKFVKDRIEELQKKNATAYKNKEWYANAGFEAMAGAGFFVCGAAGATTYAYWIPGMQLASAGAALVTMGCAAAGNHWSTLQATQKDKAWQEAEQELKEYLAEKPDVQAAIEIKRLEDKFEVVRRLEDLINLKREKREETKREDTATKAEAAPEMAKKLEELRAAKKKAAADEDFELALKLKKKIEELERRQEEIRKDVEAYYKKTEL